MGHLTTCNISANKFFVLHCSVIQKYVTCCEYLLQVWYGQQLLQLGQELRHELLQSLVIVRAVDCRKNLLRKQSELWI